MGDEGAGNIPKKPVIDPATQPATGINSLSLRAFGIIAPRLAFQLEPPGNLLITIHLFRRVNQSAVSFYDNNVSAG